MSRMVLSLRNGISWRLFGTIKFEHNIHLHSNDIIKAVLFQPNSSIKLKATQMAPFRHHFFFYFQVYFDLFLRFKVYFDSARHIYFMPQNFSFIFYFNLLEWKVLNNRAHDFWLRFHFFRYWPILHYVSF